MTADPRERAPTWLVRCAIQDSDGAWWDRQYEVAAPNRNSALDAGREKAARANPYAQAVSSYGAAICPPPEGSERRT
jgi:hypothetical protein